MRKKIWFIVIIAVTLTIFSIVNTFALFETNGYSDTEMEIGKWKIYVNDVDISVANTITLDDFVYSASSHTDDGYFAPGRSATFEIEIDASESEVAIEYSLEIDDSAIEDHPNISFSITNLDTNQVINDTEYTGVINLNDSDRTINLSIALNWANNTLYDEDDTELIGEELEFLIQANFKQYLGE